MTQDPQPPQQPQPQQTSPFAGQPMNIYPAPGSCGSPNPGQQASKPSWPMVVGIISLCIAGVFSLMTIGSLIYNAIGGTPQQRQMMENMPDWFHPYQWLAGLFTILTYVVLAIGGAMLLKRRRAGRALHVAYALMGVLVAISGLMVMITMMDHMTPPANMPPQGRVVFKATMAVSAIIGMVFALAYPTFVLIWFSRKKVIEHIRTWTS